MQRKNHTRNQLDGPTLQQITKLADEIRGLCAVVTKIARRDHQRLLARHGAGINALEHGALRRVGHGAQTLAELGRLMGLTPSTLVYVIDGLVRKGLASRGKDDKDRRRQPLALTEKGRSLLRELPSMDRESAIVQGLARMSQSDRAQLKRLLRSLVDGLRESAEWIPESKMVR